MAQSERMTENFPGTAGGPAEDPRHPNEAERADAGQSQPTGEQRNAEWYGPLEHQPTQPAEPSPWSSAGYQYVGHAPTPPGGYPPPPIGPIPGPATGPLTAAGAELAGSAFPGYPIQGVPVLERRRKPGALVAGVAVLALVVGGLAGGLGGYLVANNSGSGPVISSLNQPAPANQTANAPAGSVQAVANKVLPVVVTIAAQFQSADGSANGDTGSGVIISSDGNILTNNHVIASAASGGQIQVIFADGRTVGATVVGRDPTTDIAVIKAQNIKGLPIATLGSAANLSVGEQVVAIGAPFDLAGTVTSGIVSSLHRPTAAGDSGGASTQTTVLDAIQTDAAINPGNSGGPLVNMSDQVVGINSAIYSPNTGGQQGSQGGNVGIGFAIPIDQARRTADEIVKTGHATQTVLGVEVTDNVPSNGGQQAILPNGALIKSVTSGGPADKAGLKAGAIVVKANGRQITSSDGLVAAVHAAAPGDQMTLTLNNGGTVTATLGGQPVSTN